MGGCSGGFPTHTTTSWEGARWPLGGPNRPRRRAAQRPPAAGGPPHTAEARRAGRGGGVPRRDGDYPCAGTGSCHAPRASRPPARWWQQRPPPRRRGATPPRLTRPPAPAASPLSAYRQTPTARQRSPRRDPWGGCGRPVGCLRERGGGLWGRRTSPSPSVRPPPTLPLSAPHLPPPFPNPLPSFLAVHPTQPPPTARPTPAHPTHPPHPPLSASLPAGLLPSLPSAPLRLVGRGGRPAWSGNRPPPLPARRPAGRPQGPLPGGGARVLAASTIRGTGVAFGGPVLLFLRGVYLGEGVAWRWQ